MNLNTQLPDLSVIIVNWNTRDLLARCLRSIHDSAQPATLLEIIVVDNASVDGSAAEVCANFPSAKLIQNSENVGFATANNQALRCARGRYFLLLNSDTVVCSGALEAMADFMDFHRQAGACGARLLNEDGSLQPSAHPMLTPAREFWRLLFIEQIWRRSTYPMERWDPIQPRSVEVIKGACLMLRRKAVDQVGLLDESYFMYTEEVDLCYRLARAGWQLWWVPDARVVHFGGASSKQMREEMYIQLYRSKLQFYRKFGGESRARQAKVLLALAYAPRAAVAAVAALIQPQHRVRAHTYRRLLVELGSM